MPPIASALDQDERTVSSEQLPAALTDPRAGRGDGLIAGGLASGPRRRRRKKGRASRRQRTAVLLTSILLVAGAAGLALTLSLRGPPVQRLTGHVQISQLAAEAAVRTKAITWILQQVGPAAIVSCDAQVCTDLANDGFPSAQLVTLGPGSNDPLGSNLVVATATVRNEFGGRLGLYAPAVIASFGTKNARIDIRWVYSGGAAAYRAALPETLRVRKAADAQLLSNSNIRVSPAARKQLLSGQIDPWLPQLLAIMAYSHPLYIVDFASQSPGGGPASLLRWVDLATTVKEAHLTPTAYLGWMQSFIATQRAEFRPVWVQQVPLPTGQAVLRIGYGAPSPLS
jgi:hypothetical protein